VLTESEFQHYLLKPLDEMKAETFNESDARNVLSHQTSNAHMTLNSYISNPTGKGSAYVANRSAIKNGLNLIYIKLLREHRKNFYAIPYLYSNGDLLFYVKVPSEEYNINKISYDVLFLMKYAKGVSRANREIETFSNSPSFVYTYCFVYNKNDLLIDKLKNKYPKEALTMAPDIRNPIQSFGYEKSTYIAARYLLDGGCMSDAYINKYATLMTTFSETNTFNKIADPEVLVAVYQQAEYNKRKVHNKELAKNEKQKRDEKNKKYAEEQKKQFPTHSFVYHKAPRGKITARKAKRSLLNKK